MTAEEEAELLHLGLLDTQPPQWQERQYFGRQRIKAWGVVVDLVNNVVRPPVYPLPALIVRLAERMTGLPGLPGFRVTSANALDYRREADWLTPHADHRILGGEVVVTMSLAGSAVMTFKREKGPRHEVRVRLPRRSLQVLWGVARWSYTHEIALGDVLDERRVSVTFRHSAEVQR